jgi:hypothetical protein
MRSRLRRTLTDFKFGHTFKIKTKPSIIIKKSLKIPSSPSVFSGVRVTRSLVLYVCFVDRCLSFCTFSFGHCAVCSSSIYDSDYSFRIFKLFLIIIEGFVFILKVCPNLKSVNGRINEQ